MPPPDISARRGRGLALIAGAVLIVALVETGILAYYWFPTLTGLTCLAAAAAGRSHGTLWALGFVVTSGSGSGAVAARRPGGRQLPIPRQAVMALGLGGVIVALLAQTAGPAARPHRADRESAPAGRRTPIDERLSGAPQVTPGALRILSRKTRRFEFPLRASSGT